ncbi:MAG TPA: hypothetical protein VM219_08285, partial [Phycisphaerae bacterium]|nr:hypothetical protein [Phycisphaerae bacterium]
SSARTHLFSYENETNWWLFITRRSKMKPKPAKPKPPPTANPRALRRLELVSLIVATGITSLTSATIGNWIAAGCPRNPDGRFDLVCVAAWLAAERRKKKLPVAEDPLLIGGNSRALERYRRWKAKNEELTFQQRSGELILLEEVHTQWLALGQQMRTHLEAIGATCGPDVASALSKAVNSVYGKLPRAPRTRKTKPRSS